MSLTDAVLIAVRVPLGVWLAVEVFRLVIGVGLIALEGAGLPVLARSRFGRLSKRRELRKHGLRVGLLVAALAATVVAQLLLLD